MIRYLRNLTVIKAVPPSSRIEGMIDASTAEQEEMEALASSASVEELQNLFGMLMRTEAEIKRSGDPWMAVEMAILRMAHAPSITDLAELIRLLESKDLGRSQPAPQRLAAAATVREFKKPTPVRHPPETVARVAEPTEKKPSVAESDEPVTEAFTITQVTPLPTGTPDEAWADLKERVRQSPIGESVKSIMDHGSLISFGPTEVEIGFHKDFYRDEFENKLKTRDELRQVFEEFFGQARFRILVLAQETPLNTQKPYSAVADGQTDLDRALKNEALENPITKTVLEEFQGSSVEEITILPSKP